MFTKTLLSGIGFWTWVTISILVGFVVWPGIAGWALYTLTVFILRAMFPEWMFG
jgi:hypothetical protein